MAPAVVSASGISQGYKQIQDVVLASLYRSISLAIDTRQSLNERLYGNLYNLVILSDQELEFAEHRTTQGIGANRRDHLHKWLSRVSNRGQTDAKALQALRQLAGTRLAYLTGVRDRLDQALCLCNELRFGLEEFIENVEAAFQMALEGDRDGITRSRKKASSLMGKWMQPAITTKVKKDQKTISDISKAIQETGPTGVDVAGTLIGV